MKTKITKKLKTSKLEKLPHVAENPFPTKIKKTEFALKPHTHNVTVIGLVRYLLANLLE